MFGQLRARLQRQLRRALLANPEKTPQRIALGMAAIVLLSIVVTYNFMFEKRKREEGSTILPHARVLRPSSLGIQTRKVTDLFQERAAKRRLEHLELQRAITQARDDLRKNENEN